MPAIGMPTTLAIVLNAITVEIARPRSRYGKLSPSVALTFGKMTDAPAPARARRMSSSPKLLTSEPSTVKMPMTIAPPTRNRLRPKRSEYGPLRIAMRMPGAP